MHSWVRIPYRSPKLTNNTMNIVFFCTFENLQIEIYISALLNFSEVLPFYRLSKSPKEEMQILDNNY